MSEPIRPGTILCGLATAVPAGAMSQDAVTEMSIDRCSVQDTDQPNHLSSGQAGAIATVPADRAQTVQLRRLFRNANVDRRHVVVANGMHNADGRSDPERPFYPPRASASDRGPTTAARMQRYEADVGDLTGRAAVLSIQRARIEPSDLTHLVTVSCTGFSAPGVDIDLIDRLKLPPTIARTHIGFMGCHGLLIGMRSVDAIIKADPDARVLLCAVELCSLHFQYSPAIESLVANALFGDGAAAMIGVPSDSTAPSGSPAHWQLQSTGSLLIPGTADEMTWRIGDHGFEMHLSPEVPRIIATTMTPWLHGWLERSGVNVEEIRSWAVHPGGPKVLDAVQDAIGLPGEALAASREVLSSNGNMSSATIGFILDRLSQRGEQGPCVALAFGPGLTVEAALLQ